MPEAAATPPTVADFRRAAGFLANGISVVTTRRGDIDHAMGVLLQSRAVVGGNIQNLNAVNSQASLQSLNNTKVQAGIEDTDIAKVVGQFSQTQTALQAAYATTTRLESKTLWDYLQ